LVRGEWEKDGGVKPPLQKEEAGETAGGVTLRNAQGKKPDFAGRPPLQRKFW